VIGRSQNELLAAVIDTAGLDPAIGVDVRRSGLLELENDLCLHGLGGFGRLDRLRSLHRLDRLRSLHRLDRLGGFDGLDWLAARHTVGLRGLGLVA
jgi:hypothetical protein